MSPKSSAPATREPTVAKPPAERVVRDIRRATRKQYSAEEKIRVVLEGLRGEESIAALCRREGIAESLYCAWSKEFLEAGKRRLAGDTARGVPARWEVGKSPMGGAKAPAGPPHPAPPRHPAGDLLPLVRAVPGRRPG